MRRRCTSALAVAAALAFSANAHAAPAWLEPASLSAPSASTPAVATGSAGDAVAAWTRDIDGSTHVQARVRAPGAGYGEAQTLGTPGAGAPALGVAPDGTALAAWPQGSGVAYALRPPGGSFGAAQLLPADSGSGAASDVRVVVNSAGDALIAYARGRAFASVRRAGAAPEAPVALSSGASCDLEAALGATGLAAVAWRDCGAGATQIHAARRGSSGFATSDIGAGTAPTIAVDTAGATVVAWESGGAIRAAAAAAGGPFEGGRRINASDEVGTQPTLAAVSDGVWAAWRTTASSRVMASHRAIEGAFTTGAAVSPDGVAALPPALAGAADGSAVIAWVRVIDDSHRVEYARRAPGAAQFSAPGLVSAAALETGAPVLGADTDGNVVAGYVRGGVATVQTLDAAGPRLFNIDVRTAGHALDAYPFSVAAADAWSGVAGTTFDFGDGATAPGPAATHAYAAQGERTVTIIGTDVLGNVSAAARPFLVAPPVDRTPPVITAAKLDAKRFRRTRRETAVVAAVRRRGTRFRYTLSEPAQVNIFFERVLMGRRRGKSCIRGRRTGRRCRVYEPAGLITRAHPIAGPVSTAFSGRIVGRSGPLKIVDVYLKPGRYRATIVASDANRNVSKPVQLAFTMLR